MRLLIGLGVAAVLGGCGVVEQNKRSFETSFRRSFISSFATSCASSSSGTISEATCRCIAMDLVDHFSVADLLNEDKIRGRIKEVSLESCRRTSTS